MIRLDNVSKTLKGRDVLCGVSLRADSGQILGLQGANGSGKTMILRILAGFVYATSGNVEVNGRVLSRGAQFPSSLGVLIESPEFLPHYTGLENLKLLASIRRVIGDKDVREWSTRVGLDPDDGRTFKKYSLGMRQRLGLAAAFMEQPDVVLLDEPTNALDPEGIAMVKREVLCCKERGAAVVVACHDASVLEDVADEIAVMAEGRIIGWRSGEDILVDEREGEVMGSEVS